MRQAKRANGEGSVYFHAGRKLWCAKITAGGRSTYLYAPSRREAARRLRDAQNARQRGTVVVGSSPTLGAFLDRWLRESVRPNVRPWTYKGYEVVVRVHLSPELGRVRIIDLSPQMVQEMLHRKIDAGLSAKSVQHIRGILRNALNEAMRWDLVARNVAALVRPPRSEKKQIVPFTPDEARHLLAATATHRLGALYSLALSLGLRQGEALGLTWSNVDLETKTIRVVQQLQRRDAGLTLVPLKTAQSVRTLPLPDMLANRLIEHARHQRNERRAAGARWQETGLVFTSTIGSGLDGPNVTKEFQRLLKANGIARRRFHDLRHSCASLLLVQNVAPRVVMEILGHSQISLTMNTYSHVLPELKWQAAASMDSLLAPEQGALVRRGR